MKTSAERIAVHAEQELVLRGFLNVVQAPDVEQRRSARRNPPENTDLSRRNARRTDGGMILDRP